MTFFWIYLLLHDLTGTVTQADGLPASQLAVALTGPRSLSTLTDHSGAFSFLDLPNGRYLVSVGNLEQKVELVNQSLDLTLALEPEHFESLAVWQTEISSSNLYLGASEIGLKQASHLSDLLRDQPGVDVGGTHSVNQRINMRGLDDTDLEITIDGANQNAYMYHHMGNLLINADILKKVELGVGAGSVRHAGLGGSVQFETKDPQDLLVSDQSWGSRFSGSYFSNKAQLYSVTSYGHLSDRWHFLGYGYLSDRENPKDGSGLTNIGHAGQIVDLLAKVTGQITPNQVLKLSLGSYSDHGDYAHRPDMGAATNGVIPNSALPYPTEYERQTANLSYGLSLQGGRQLDATLYHNELSLWRDEAVINGPISEGAAENSGFEISLRGTQTTGKISHQWVTGLDSNGESGLATKAGIAGLKEKGFNLAIYAEDQLYFQNGIRLTPGIRWDRYQSDSATAQETFNQVSGALAFDLPIISGLHLVGHGRQLFKGPELSEIFTNASGSKIPNPDIKPETGINAEFGLQYQLIPRGLDILTFSANVFRTLLADKIERIRLDNGFMDQNTGDVIIDGFELSTHLGKDHWQATLHFSHSDSEYEETGLPLEREIGDSWSLNLDWEMLRDQLFLNWNTQWVEAETHVVSGDPKPAYQVHNLVGRWTPSGLRGLTLTLGIDNLLDETYVSHASRVGVNNHPVYGTLVLNDFEPGRNIKCSLAYSF